VAIAPFKGRNAIGHDIWKMRFVGATLAVALSRLAINDGINYM